MAGRAFQHLRVYQMAEKLADRIWDLIPHWPILARDTVGKQIVRAADSIGANIAEGVGRGTYADNRRFVRVARGSLYETMHFLRRAFKRKLIDKERVDSLKPLIDALGPSINAHLNSIGPAR